MAKIYHLTRHDFEEIYFTLQQYANPGNMNVTYQECADKALDYAKKNILGEKPDAMDDMFGEGYRLIYYKQQFENARVIWISPNQERIFYEGVVPMRTINELNIFDYITLGINDLQLLAKKYKLIVDDGLKILLREVVMRNRLAMPENDKDELWFNQGVRQSCGADMFKKIHAILELGKAGK